MSGASILGGKFAGFVENRERDIRRGFLKTGQGGNLVEVAHVFQDEAHIAQRGCVVGHVISFRLSAGWFSLRRKLLLQHAWWIFSGAGRLPGRHQVLLAVADQVGAAHAACSASRSSGQLSGIVVAQEGLVQPALAAAAHDGDVFRCRPSPCCSGFLPVWYIAVASASGVGRKVCTWSRRKSLLLQPQRQFEHVLVGGARMRGDEVGDQVLLLAGLLRKLVEHRLELVVAAHARLHHFRQRPFLGVLGRDLQVAADVVRHQFLDVFGRAHGEVVAQAGADQHLLDAGQRARLAVELDQRRVVGVEVLADAGIDAGQAPAGRTRSSGPCRPCGTCWRSARRGRK